MASSRNIILALAICAVLFGIVSGEGPLCYSCDAEVYPDTCSTLTRCGSHERCFLEAYENTIGVLMYRSGCKSNVICDTTMSNSRISRSTGTTVCSECCSGSYCNVAGCGYQGSSVSVNSVSMTTKDVTSSTKSTTEKLTTLHNNNNHHQETAMTSSTTVNQGNHGPVCFICHAEVYPDTCTKTQQCGMHELCYLEKYENTLGTVMYRSGCKDKYTCVNIKRKRNNKLRDLTDVTLCAECCTGSHCNGAGCGYKAPHIQNSNISIRSTTSMNAIHHSHQLTHTAPHRTHQSSTFMSKSSTATTMLPSKVSTATQQGTAGPICFMCHAEVFPDTCTKTQQCGTHELCYLEKYENTLGTVMYRSGCKDNYKCVNIKRKRNNKLRDLTDVTLCAECCTGSYCNAAGCGYKATQIQNSNSSIRSTTTMAHAVHHTHNHTPIQSKATTVSSNQSTHTTPHRTHHSSTFMPKSTASTTMLPSNVSTATQQTTTVTMGNMCYSCTSEIYPNTCKHKIQCGIHELCYLEKYENTMGEIVYKSGCKSKHRCDRVHQHQHHFRKSVGTMICLECCHGSYCNDAGCGFSVAPATTNSLHGTNTKTSTQVMTNAHKTTTKHGMLSHTSVSTDNTIPTTTAAATTPVHTVTPSNALSTNTQGYTGSGPLCAKCYNIHDPHSCKNVTRCQNDEQCMAMFYTDSSKQRIHSLGCMQTRICNTFHQEYHSEDRCQQCCGNGDACNSHGCPLVGDIGPVCFNCSNIEHPDQCHNMHLCENDEECFLQVRSDIHHKHTYYSGCRKRSICQQHNGLPSITQHSVEYCCTSPLCNNKIPDTGSLVTTTTKTRTSTDPVTTKSTATSPTTTTTTTVPTTTDSTIYKHLRDSIKLQCSVPSYVDNVWWEFPHGNPGNSIQRYLGGNVYELVIIFAEHYNSGTYHCKAKNGYGFPYTVKTYVVDVK